MKISFKNADELTVGLSYVLPELGVEMAEDGEYTIVITKVEKNALKIKLDGKNGEIIYGGGAARFFRGLATIIAWIKAGKTKGEKKENPIFNTNGVMLDVSRNAVMNLKTIKFMLRKMALMGQNMLMMYSEDTYEIPNRPYFGHLRGRYTKEQIQEIDSYAIELGIEVIPCIQVLGHLATALIWGDTAPYKDTKNVLLVGAEETYELIEDMLKAVSEAYTTKRIHIGLDETHDLGTGAYLDKNGYLPREEIYFEHLKKVKMLLDKYGFEPMMWSDMFFRLSGRELENYIDYDVRVELPENIGEKTQGIQQVFWDYYNPDEEFYRVNMEKHKLLGDNTVFAGGVWAWSSFSVLYSYSLKMTVPALDAAKKANIKEVIATVWHNGSEANIILALAGIAWYADYDYAGCYDEESMKECFYNATGLKYDDFAMLEEIEKPVPTAITSSRAVMYNDPLAGTADAYLANVNAKEYYGKLTEKLKKASEGKGMFAEAFKVIEKISYLYELKADFGIRLRKAYMAKDIKALEGFVLECDEIIKRINAYREAHRTAWMKYNSPFGWEVHDIRIGGQLCRFDTAKMLLKAYINGEIDSIDELEADRLFFDSKHTAEIGSALFWLGYREFGTVNVL